MDALIQNVHLSEVAFEAMLEPQWMLVSGKPASGPQTREKVHYATEHDYP